MKKLLSISILGIIIISGLGAASISVNADNAIATKTVIFSKPKILENKDTITIEMAETNTYLIQQGKPLIPKYSEEFVYPFGTKVLDVIVTPSQTQEIKLKKDLMTSPIAVTVGLISKDVSQVHITETYPNKWFDYRVTTGLVGQEKMVQVVIDVVPVQYDPIAKTAIWASEVDIKIDVEKPKESTPTNAEYEFIILTADDFYNQLTPLKNHKINRGITTEIFKLSTILSGQGDDDQEKIKYFIKDAIENYGTTSVMLVGTWYDSSTSYQFFPTRKAHVYMNDPDHNEFVSDLYYADIYDGEGEFATWDSNENDIHGEFHETITSKIDDLDLHPDVMLGRLAVKTSDELNIIVNKIINYENQVAYTKNWFTNMVVVGGDSFIDDQYDEDGVLEGELVNQKVEQILDGFIPKEMWVSNGVLDKISPSGITSISDAIDDGCGFIDFSGHGNTNVWATHPHLNDNVWLPTTKGGFFSSDIGKLSNNEKLPIVVTGACSVGKFNKDRNCFSFSWLTNPNGGGIASFGSTALGYAYISSYVTQGLVEKMSINMFESYDNGAITTGEMWTRGINDYLTNPGLDSDADYKTIMEWQMFGDPTLAIADESLAPEKPDAPEGKTTGDADKEYTYTASTIDPDGDQIYYLFDWGDEKFSGWVGPYNSGQTAEASHKWNRKGNYEIRVKAKDDHGVQSDWSDPLPISVPKNKAINPFLQFLERLIERFPISEQILQPIYDRLTDF